MRAHPIGLVLPWALAGFLVPAAAFATDIWFIGGGIEAPRTGQGVLAYYNRPGPTLVVGGEHELAGAMGVTMRFAYSDFPSNPAAVQRETYVREVLKNHAAHLYSFAGGLRLRRRDTRFSPYFDVGFGLGLIDTQRRYLSAGVPVAPEPPGIATSWAWTWGTGLACRVRGRYGAFLDGHWDTVPGGPDDHSWTAAVRAGMERR